MNICGKRKYINPYSRGAVLCKLAERQMKGKFKRTWTHQEKERESSQLFQNACVEMQKLPGNEECSKFLVLHPNFKGRNWLHVKKLIEKNRILQ
ncbi:hypothetical protein Avbf_05919, partial [Armadillidium vulgare]